jgi:hypothetical protein
MSLLCVRFCHGCLVPLTAAKRQRVALPCCCCLKLLRFYCCILIYRWKTEAWWLRALSSRQALL